MLLFLLVLLFTLGFQANAKKLCTGSHPLTYLHAAKNANSELLKRLEIVGANSIAKWYSDNSNKQEVERMITDYFAACKEETVATPVVVVYGLPNKDCEAGQSNYGYNKNSAQYKQFIDFLSNKIGRQKVILVLEPDALGILASSGHAQSNCGYRHGYMQNLQYALARFSKQNPNVVIYLDIGHWVFHSSDSLGKLKKAMEQLNPNGNKYKCLKGISLNTSNYRKTDEMVGLCKTFRSLTKSDSHCVIDTSRNYNGPTPSQQWCNAVGRGIGAPPTSNTGISIIDYFIWIKVPGESDGTHCPGTETEPVRVGAGRFSDVLFNNLYKNGYFADASNKKHVHQDKTPPKVKQTKKPKPTRVDLGPKP